MTSNTSSSLPMQCTSGKECGIEEYCAFDQNATSYECQLKTSVPKGTWIIDYSTSLPQWYPPEDQKEEGQTCQHPSALQAIYDYYGNCRNGLFCDKGSNVCMKKFKAGNRCLSSDQCIFNECNEVCASNKPYSRKQDVITASILAFLAVVGLISILVIKIKRKRMKVKDISLSDGHYEDRCSTQRLSSGNTSHKTTSFVTINGENMMCGPYFGDQGVINPNINNATSHHLPIYRERLSLLSSGERTPNLSDRESHTTDVLSIIRNSFQQQENKSNLTSENNLSDNRISKSTFYSYSSSNQSASFKDAFDEFSPPSYKHNSIEQDGKTSEV